MKYYTYAEFIAEHPDDAACLAKVMRARYGGTEIKCPGCHKQAKFHPMGKRRAYACQLCGHHVYPCVGTPFEKSRTPLSKWLFAMYLFTTSRHGVAGRELERQLGVTHKCAWRMAHQLRELMAKADNQGPLSGHVEVDEAYHGGAPRRKGVSKRGRGAPKKAITLGIAERNGNVRAIVVPDIKVATLQGAIEANVTPGSRISSDELSSYVGLAGKGYDHATVAHGKREFVRGDVHTNSIEGYWSRLKNSIRGTHVHVSKRHLAKYAAEFSFRYNMRKQPREMFHRLISSV